MRLLQECVFMWMVYERVARIYYMYMYITWCTVDCVCTGTVYALECMEAGGSLHLCITTILLLYYHHYSVL